MSNPIRQPARCFALLMASLAIVIPAHAGSILFIGNSFTFAFGSPVRYYRADSVTDINGTGESGVPALFKSFSVEAGLTYDVALETQPGVGIDWHLEHKLDVIGSKAWDSVVMHGYSTLDPMKPGDPGVLIATVKKMSEFLRAKNAAATIRIMSTWPRADQTYEPKGAWYGKPIEAMGKDVRAGYDLAARGTNAVKAVIPVGDAWLRAMHGGIADSNPYDGIEAGKLNLWTYDGYHASSAGSYLEALVVFGAVTGLDPRRLSSSECSGFELGLSEQQVGALEQVAYEELNAQGFLKSAPLSMPKPSPATKCKMPSR